MIKIYYDFHIHSALSPCGDEDNTVNNIVNMSKLKNLDAIAISDHNSCLNCAAALKAGQREGILVIPAMELTTSEEIHVLFLFSKISDAESFSSYVEQKRMKIKNDAKIFGRQIIMDEYDKEKGEVDYLLTVSSNIGIYDAVNLAKEYAAVAIPAHVDKQSNSLLGILGFYDDALGFSAVESKKKTELNLPYITNSDAHYLADISERENFIYANSLSAEDIIKSLKSGLFKEK